MIVEAVGSPLASSELLTSSLYRITESATETPEIKIFGVVALVILSIVNGSVGSVESPPVSEASTRSKVTKLASGGVVSTVTTRFTPVF